MAYPVSARFKAALPLSHTIVTRCEIYGQNGSDPITTLSSVTDGSVSVDSKQNFKRSGWFSTSDQTLVPANWSDLLVPYVNEFKLYRGIKYYDGTTELCPIGRFVIWDVQIYDSLTNFSLRITGYDKAKRVAKNVLKDTYNIASGTNVATAIHDLLNFVYPGLTFNFTPTSQTTPTLAYTIGTDPWGAASDLALTIGCVLYFDVNGVCTLTPVPDPATAPVAWDYTDSQTQMILYANKHLGQETTANHVIVLGEHVDSTVGTVRGEAMDTDPGSPTYVNGPYGDVPIVIRDRSILTAAGCVIRAQAELLQILGVSEAIELTHIVNPIHDFNDVIHIGRPKSKIDAKYIIDGMSIPLTHDRSMTLSTRKRQTSFA